MTPRTLFGVYTRCRRFAQGWKNAVAAMHHNQLNALLQGAHAKPGANGVAEAIATTRKYDRTQFLNEARRDSFLSRAESHAL